MQICQVAMCLGLNNFTLDATCTISSSTITALLCSSYSQAQLRSDKQAPLSLSSDGYRDEARLTPGGPVNPPCLQASHLGSAQNQVALGYCQQGYQEGYKDRIYKTWIGSVCLLTRGVAAVCFTNLRKGPISWPKSGVRQT